MTAARNGVSGRQERMMNPKTMLLSIIAAALVVLMLLATLNLETRSLRTTEQRGVLGEGAR
jgi:hypothetical protein